MTTKWEMISARRRDKKLQNALGMAQEWMVWRKCQLCGKKYCANNYPDRKARISKWHGIEICPWCKYSVVKMIPRLMKLGILRWGKGHKPK